jgi:SSS family solute:Na+ symporter
VTATATNGPALAVFIGLFALVTLLGFVSSRWKRPASMAHLDEWGLGGRRFGTWVTWFLIGGDAYTAYTVIAVPALIYSAGAFGFFALPYAILAYPIMFVVQPRLWTIARAHGCVTSADIVHVICRSRALELAVALTGVLATMPYIALQLVGMAAALRGIGLNGELPIIIAFAVLAVYTYSSGLRAPALIAFVKDLLIYAVVIAAVVIIPVKLGGYDAMFAAADAVFRAKGTGGILLAPQQQLPYATLVLGSAFALFMYPHVMTGVLAARSADTVRRNAVLLPIYSILLGLIALLGLAAHAAGLKVAPNDAVPALFAKLFPGWFAGAADAAIAIGALVPAALMSIGAANLFTRNVWKAYLNRQATPAAEAQVAKATSVAVKIGALAFVLLLPVQYALDLQLLGGIWILQTFPPIVGSIFLPQLRPLPLLAGWAAGFAYGTWTTFADGTKPLHTLSPGVVVYTGVLALIINVAVAVLAQIVAASIDRHGPRSA